MNNERAITGSCFLVGSYSVVPSRNLIIHDGKETLITPKMLAVLTELAKHQSETLSKEQLLLAVWGTLHTSDMVLSRAISDLRKVFSDSARQQHTIETVTKQGYRLKEKVVWQQTTVDVSDEVTPVETELSQSKSSQLPPSKLAIRHSSSEPSLVATSSDSEPSKEVNKSLYMIVFMLLAATVFIVINSNTSAPDELGLEYENNYLTLNDDTERNIRFSVDGKYLAYVSYSSKGSGSTIKLQSISDKSVLTIGGTDKTAQIYSDIAPTFSPDGKKIAYKHFSKKSGCTINVYSINDATIQTLAECPMSKTDALDWSPDGKYIVSTMFNYIEKVESLVLVNVLTGKNKTLLAPTQPASGYLWPRFSPDGRSIAVVHFQPNNNLWVIGLVDIKSGKFSEIIALGEEVSQVVWNEVGDALYYLVVRSKDKGIWQVNLSTKAELFLVDIDSSSLDYDAKADKFAYIEREAQLNIWRSSQTDSGEINSQPLFQNLSQTNYPSLSPDNKHLAFIATESGVDSLWVRTIESNANLLLLQAEQNDKLSEPTWSPDGKQLLVSALNKAQSRMIEFDMELGNSRLFAANNNVKMGKWSRDGRFMYWYEQIDGIWQVMEHNLSTAQKKIVLSYPVSRFESIDGKNLYYQKIGTVNVHSRDLKQSKIAQPKDEMSLSLRGTYSWDAHLNAIYYISRSVTNTTNMLFRMDLPSGEIEELYPLKVMPTDAGRNLSIGEDGRVAYYTKLDKYRTDIVLMTKK